MYGQGNYHPQFRPPPFQQSQLNPPPLFQQAPPGPQPLPIPHNPPHFLAQHPPPFPPRAPPQYQQNVPQPQQPGPYMRTLPIPPPIQGSSQVPPLYSQHNASYPPVHFSQPIPPLPRLFPPPPPPPHSQGQVLYRTPPGPPPPLHGIQHVRAPPPPLSSGFISVTPAPYAPSFPPMPPPPPPPPPSSPPPPPPSPPPPTSPTVERTGFLKVPSSSPLSHDILEAPVALADNETDISENKGPVAEEKASVNLSLPPPKPADEEVVRNIEVLCQSMVKDGPDFENIVRKEEEGNPQFAFLFGGESGSAAAIGHEYFQWMKKKYLLEKDLLKVSEQKKSPVHSDMDMEDDSDQTDACKVIDKLDKESTGEVISLGSELLAVKQTSPAPSATEKITAEADSILTCSASVLHDDEDDSNLPFIEDVSPVRASPNASELALDYSSQVFVSMPNDDSSRLKVSSTLAVSGIMEAPGVHVKDGSPFRLIQGYASDYSEDDDRKENKSSEDINSYRISPSNKILDLQDGKCNDKFEKCENFQKNNLVDDDNMNAKHQAGKHKLEEGVSDSESDEKQFSERNDKRDKRHRSESWSTKINDFGNYDRHDAAPSSELGKSATTEMDVGGTQNDPLKVTVKDDIGDIKVTERQQIEGAQEAPSNLTEEERTKALLSSSQSLQDDSMLVQSSSSGSQPSQKIPPTNILEVQNFAQDSHQELLSCSLPSQAAQPPSSHPHMNEAPITQNSYLPSKEFSLPPGCPPSSHFPFENPRVQYTSEHHADYQTQPAPPSHFPSHRLAVASDYHSQGLSLLHTGWPNISPPPLRHNFNPMTRPYPPGEMTDPRRSFHLVEPSHQPPYMDIKRKPLSPIGIHLDHSSVREDSFSHPHMRNGPQIASDSQRDYHLRNHLFHRPPSYGLEVPLTSNDPPNSSEQDLFKPSLHKYPSSFLDKKPPHYNPYASIFEQVPSSSKFLSSFSGQDNNTNHSIKYDSSFSSGHILAGESRSRLTSSPPNLKGPGLHHQENNSKAYDPLFDSIEPSLKTIENAKKESTGAKTKLEVDELGEGATDAEAGAVENASPQLDEKDWSPAFQLDLGNAGAGEIEIDQGGSPGKNKNSKDSRSMRLFKIALADFVKEVLKPSWKQGNMSKESFKTIVKKTVEKVSGSMSSHQIPKSQAKINQYVESSQRKLTKLVMGYVDKYVKP